ncbi:cell wall hydrolase [Sphingomonas sp.]|uniref:cell wall hydrolase n=1 Tax=Sphingomonas sp. TaxID=28214 RepID=UPI003B005DD1
MTLHFRSYLGAALSIATVVTPATLASSTSAQVLQTRIEPLPEAATDSSVLPAAPVTVADAGIAAVASDDAAATADDTPDARQVECIAKIIMHEAAYEPRSGRVAVAQVVRTRIRSGRFAADACGVARQRGQFFDVDAFRPSRDGTAWADAVAIAAETLRGDGEEVVPGALFFHAAYSPMPGRVRVGQIGGHVFYR